MGYINPSISMAVTATFTEKPGVVSANNASLSDKNVKITPLNEQP